jgi:hypothetical protein
VLQQFLVLTSATRMRQRLEDVRKGEQTEKGNVSTKDKDNDNSARRKKRERAAKIIPS